MKQSKFFIESSKGVIFSSNTPCALIQLYANLKGLFNISELNKKYNFKEDKTLKITKY